MLGLAALITALSACGSAESPSSLLQISPASPEVAPGDAVKFIATSPAAPDDLVAWAVMEANGGTIDTAGVYTAPGSEGTYTVTASLSSLSTTQSTQVRVKRNVRVDVSPTAATLAAGDSITLSAGVTGAVKTVTWSVAEGTAGGAVTAAGVYTAPLTAGVYDVVATSAADPTKSGSATITVTAPAPSPAPLPATVTIAVSPLTASVVAGNTVQFTASITGSTNAGVSWSVAESGGGTVSAAGVYTAPATAGTYHVVATSQADTSKTSSATLTVAAPPPPPPPTSTGVVTAFPGAQGGGALSKGGRGGVVYEVTNLNDSGTGSLRACVAATGPRTCVFRVSGTITLASMLSVTNPYLTVAGQTAPGGGIQISGKNLTGWMMYVTTHDVVWRYTRLRKGYNSGTVSNNGGIVTVWDPSYNVIFDHNSFEWSQEDTVQVWGGSGTPPKDVTFSWNIIAEPVSPQQTAGAEAAADTRAKSDLVTNVDFHHNLLANFSHRGPQASNKSYSWVNNIVYNWQWFASQFIGGVQADIIGNVWKCGPMACGGTNRKHEIEVLVGGTGYAANGSPSLYVTGNKGPSNGDPGADNWNNMVREITTYQGEEVATLSTGYRRTTPLTVAAIPITPDSASTVETSVPNAVGASQRMSCDGAWVSSRDSADARIVNEFKTGTGISSILFSETDVGGFPSLAGGTLCVDSDHDGMPDAWETARGLNPNDASDGRQVATDGYTYLERYLSGL